MIQIPQIGKFHPKMHLSEKNLCKFFMIASGLNDSMGQAFALRELEAVFTEEICSSLN